MNNNPITITSSNITTGTFTFDVLSLDRYAPWPDWTETFDGDTIYTEVGGVLKTWVITTTAFLLDNSATLVGTTAETVAPVVGSEGLIISPGSGYYPTNTFKDPLEQLIKINRSEISATSYSVLPTSFTPSTTATFENTTMLTPSLGAGTYEYSFVGTYSTTNAGHGVGLEVILATATDSIVGSTLVASTTSSFFNDPVSTGIISSIIHTTSPALTRSPIKASGIIPLTITDTLRVRFARSGATGTLETGILTWKKIK